MTIINSLEKCDILYKHKTDEDTFILNTAEIKELLNGSNIKDNEVMLWIKEYVNENIRSITTI
jgi:hypothetical protein